MARQPAVHLERLLLRVLDHVCPRRGSLRVSSRPAWGLSVGGSSAWRTGLRRVEALVEILRERRRHLVRVRVRVRVGASLSGASTCAGKRTALCEWREGWRWCLLRVRERQLHHTGVELKKRVEHVHAARRARSEHDRCRAHRSKVGKHGSVRARCWRPREYGTCLYCVALQLGCAQYLGYFERALFWYLCKAPNAFAAKTGCPMGCGASIQASPDKPAKRGWFGLTRQPPPAAAAPTRITTPPEGLRIQANARSAPAMRRQDFGMAATPVGKQAEEYKFFCPLCMMFYRTMREMPCCQQ